MVREDLIEGAVSFLQDPSVSTAPLEQKVAFLRSKNLTQEEIDTSLARAGGTATPQTAVPQSQSYPQQQRRPPQYDYNNNIAGYQNAYWGQPPPELPRRDWRDWFIMATVVGGVGYGLYWTAKRYVYPLIAPPTPEQLVQDKASIDESFEKAFALLDQLATDTQELKDSEKARSERLDHALSEVEAVIGRMKEANEERQREAKSMARELTEVREQIPKALEKERKSQDDKLADLTNEMKSLKTLVQNRMHAPLPQQASYTPPQPQQQPQRTPLPASYSSQPPTPSATVAPETNGLNGAATEGEKAQASSVLPERSSSSSARTFGGRPLGGSAKIPEWQLAAKRKKEEEAAKQEGSGDGEIKTPEVTDAASST